MWSVLLGSDVSMYVRMMARSTASMCMSRYVHVYVYVHAHGHNGTYTLECKKYIYHIHTWVHT
jgi:hypothetical protein